MASPLFQRLPDGSSILFIRLRNLGEAVLDTANLHALKSWRPDLRITILVEAIYTDLFAADPAIEPLGLPRGGAQRRSHLKARLAILREVRRRRFTAVVNLHGGPTSAQLTLLSGAPHRVGAAHFRPSFSYNLQVPEVDQILERPGISRQLHTVENQWALFRWLGLPGEAPAETRLIVAPAFQQTAATALAAVGIDPTRPYAVIAPTNEFDTKRWMPERFAAIAADLRARGLQVVMTGAPTAAQRAQLAAVEAAAAAPLPALSQLRIGELVAVIAGAQIFVGNDSGPAHIAAAVRTPQVVLFGPASSVRWHPWKAPARLVQNYFPCNPCAMFKCEQFPEPECIRSISVEQVREAIDQLKIGASWKRERIEAILNRFAAARIIVLGDLMLDEFIWGEVRRISPEAPVPVVEVRRETIQLGGAGNVVSNLIELGATAIPVGIVGDDEGGRILRELCRARHASVADLLTVPGRPTTRKTRIVAHSQQMVRADREDRSPIDHQTEALLRERLVRDLPEADALIISDYEKGLLTPDLLREVIAAARQAGKPVCLDPKIRNFLHYRQVDLITPNQLEAERATGIEIVDEASLTRAAQRIRELLDCRHVLITRGEHGMTLLEESGVITNIPTTAREVYDVTGAGDTVIATFTLALAAGASLVEAAIIANQAAGIVVGKVGTATVSRTEIANSVS